MLLIVCSSPINLLGFIVSSVLLIVRFVPAISFLLLRALACLLSFPRVYTILNLNSPSLLDYRAYLYVSTLEVVKYVKFL